MHSFIAGWVKASCDAKAKDVLRARLQAALNILDGGGPPDEPPGRSTAAPAGNRGVAEPNGAWYNRARMGRPTQGEVLFAACCIFSTNLPQDIFELCEEVQKQEVQWAQGDAWAPPVNEPPSWANGGVVCRVLDNALAAKDVDFARVGQHMWASAKVELQHEQQYLSYSSKVS